MSVNSTGTDSGFGAGRVEVDISELIGMRNSAKSLIDEMTAYTPSVLSQARSAANRSFSEYGDGVSNQSNAVLTQCDNLSGSYVAALNELEDLASGLDKAIAGYLTLEQDLISAGGSAVFGMTAVPEPA